jgi:S-formylglutathione hydrolase FrmB
MKIIKAGLFAQILFLSLALSLPFSVQAQKAETENVVKLNGFQNYKLNSKLTNREMPYRVILPANYNNSNEKTFYPVIYLLHGLTGHFDNWTDRTKLAEYAKKYNYIIVTPEGGDGWYTDSVSVPADKYESYIIQELIPEVDKKFRTIADREHRFIAGLSMGGYGAIKFGLKYPEKFALVGSFSGALGIVALPSKATTTFPSIKNVFGEDESPTRKNNDIFRVVRESTTEQIKALPFIYFDCGTEDFLFQSNRDFADLLIEKKIKHEFRQLPGRHDWTYWNAQVQQFLELSGKFIK